MVAACSARRPSNSIPPMRGILRSVITIEGDHCVAFSSPSAPSRAVSTRNPQEETSSASPDRSFSSSSTINIFSWLMVVGGSVRSSLRLPGFNGEPVRHQIGIPTIRGPLPTLQGPDSRRSDDPKPPFTNFNLRRNHLAWLPVLVTLRVYPSAAVGAAIESRLPGKRSRRPTASLRWWFPMNVSLPHRRQTSTFRRIS